MSPRTITGIKSRDSRRKFRSRHARLVIEALETRDVPATIALTTVIQEFGNTIREGRTTPRFSQYGMEKITLQRDTAGAMRPVTVEGIIDPTITGEDKVGGASAPLPISGANVGAGFGLDRGHLMGLQLGGTNTQSQGSSANIVPQWSEWQEHGPWSDMENRLSKAARLLQSAAWDLSVSNNALAISEKTPGSGREIMFRVAVSYAYTTGNTYNGPANPTADQWGFPIAFQVDAWAVDYDQATTTTAANSGTDFDTINFALFNNGNIQTLNASPAQLPATTGAVTDQWVTTNIVQATAQPVWIYDQTFNTFPVRLDSNTIQVRANANAVVYVSMPAGSQGNLTYGTHYTIDSQGNVATNTALVLSPTPPGGGGAVQTTLDGHTPFDNALTPAQVRQAYGFDRVQFAGPDLAGPIVGDGSGQTIALVTAYDDPTIASDLEVFNRRFGLPTASLTKVGLDATGSASTVTMPPVAPPGATITAAETALDVEWAHAIAPGARILLVEAHSSRFGDLLNAVDYARNAPGVSVVSMSWGGQEGSMSGSALQSLDSHFRTPTGHSGVTFVAASGDSVAPSWPSVSPDVVAVGGTTLTLANGAFEEETAWQGSGGGLSRSFARPLYQDQGVAGGPPVPSGGRAAPDVAYAADPANGFAVYDSSSSGGWSVLGGTSAGAPQWAALIAIANQGRAAHGLAPLDGPTQTLPLLYQASAQAFHDVTEGSNGVYQAGPGFDLVTGRGSPVANLLIPELATAAVPQPSQAGLGDTAKESQPGRKTSTPDLGSAHSFDSSNTAQLLVPAGTEFFAGDPNGLFTTTGELDSVLGNGQTVRLFNATSTGRSFNAMDLLNGTGTLAGANPIAVGGASFVLSTLRVEPNGIQLRGTVTLPQLGNFQVQAGVYLDSGIQLQDFTATVPSASFTVGGVVFTGAGLAITFTSTKNEFDLSGTLSANLAGSTVSLALGSASAPGLSIVNGVLTRLTATVTSPSLTVGGATLTPSGLQLTYASMEGHQTFTLSGGATLTAGATAVELTLGDASSQGLVIQDGVLQTVDATVTATPFHAGGVTFTPSILHLSYFRANSHEIFRITGGATLTAGATTLGLALGGPGSPGLVIQDGTLTTIDAAVAATPFTAGGVTITPSALHLGYSTAGSHQVISITGGATLTAGGTTLGLVMGGPGSPGLVIRDGAVTTIDAALTATPFHAGGVTITPSTLHLGYSTAGSHQVISITGGATLTVGSTAMGLALGDSSSQGLVIQDGAVTTIDATVKATPFTVGGVTITPSALHLGYSTANAQQTLSITGGAAISGASVPRLSVQLGGGSTAGLVIQDGSLTQLDASVTADIPMLGLTLGVQALTVRYVAPTAASPQSLFEMYGAASLSTVDKTLRGLSATLGNAASPGLVIEDGALKSLNIGISGSFRLYGPTFTANGLTVQYTASTGVLQISGGATVTLAPGIAGGVNLPAGGLTVNTTTGAVQVNGLEVTTSVNFASIGINDLDVKYVNVNNVMTVSASGTVVLPGGIAVGGTMEFTGGELTDIALAYDGSPGITVGQTGLFITHLAGGVHHLDNLSQLLVNGQIGLTYGKSVSFAGGSYALFTAAGTITYTTGDLTIDGTCSLVNGYLGTGAAHMDLNWGTRSYSLEFDTRLLGGFSEFHGSLRFDSTNTVHGSADFTWGHVPGTSFSVIHASGNLTVDSQALTMSADVSLAGGTVGTGTATLAMNWTMGTYALTGFDVKLLGGGLLELSGDLSIGTNGYVTADARLVGLQIPGTCFSLIDASVSLSITPQSMTLVGSMSLLGGLGASGYVDLYMDWKRGIFAVNDIDASLFGGVISIKGSGVIDSQGNLTANATATAAGFIGVSAYLQVRPYMPAWDTFVDVYTNTFLTGWVGGRFKADGSSQGIGWGEIYQDFSGLLPNGTYHIVAQTAPGQALEVAGGSTSAGAGIDLGRYTGAANQQWQLNQVGEG